MKGKLGLIETIFSEDEDITFKGFGTQNNDRDNSNDDTIAFDLPVEINNVNNFPASHEVLEDTSFGATFLHENM